MTTSTSLQSFSPKTKRIAFFVLRFNKYSRHLSLFIKQYQFTIMLSLFIADIGIDFNKIDTQNQITITISLLMVSDRFILI